MVDIVLIANDCVSHVRISTSVCSFTHISNKFRVVITDFFCGRLESKRRMKDAAYANLYELMFKFLLAYCDEKRVYARVEPTGEYVEGNFNRYNFLDGKPGDIYYNDRFLFYCLLREKY